MSKLDVYLRSIERFGAAGAVLTSGQAVTLRFPTGDRHATQVTPHDQLVALVREIAPPNVLDQIEKHRPARFEIDSNGTRYAISIAPKPGVWQIAIAGAAAAPAAAPVPAVAPAPRASTQAAPPPSDGAPDMTIERGQYDSGPAMVAVSTSGSTMLDQLTRTARTARATDVYLSTGAPPIHRINGDLAAAGTLPIDADVISRELGIVAPPSARSAWSEVGTAMFTYGDGVGRVRVSLTKDHHGPSASLRLLPPEPPGLDQLGLPRQVHDWLGSKGLIVIAGPSGSGKTVTLGSLVRALGEQRRRVITIEDPIELVHANAWISQRAVFEHVGSVSAAVASAMNEGADAIVIGRVMSPATAYGIVEAVSGGHLVLTSVVAPVAGVALDRIIAHLVADQRELAHGLLFSSLLGTIQPVVSGSGARSFEITARQA